MAINIGTNFAYHGKLPNFDRDKFKTKAAMMAFDENSIDEGHLSYCEEDGNVYQYKSANTVDTTTGKWRLFKTEADAALNGTSTNPIQNKAVFDVLKLKADAAALGGYQPKYNADYVATKHFNYSELSDDIRVIDLNGYVMNIIDSSDTVTIDNKEFYNGIIYINQDVSFSDSMFFNSFIHSSIGFHVDTSIFYYCRIAAASIDEDTICYFCKLDFSTINTSHALMCCIAEDCDYNAADIGSEPIAYCSYLSDKFYINATIVDGHLAEYNFETDVDNPVVKGNAPSCEAVNAKFANYATKTELNSKADASELDNYTTTATTDAISADVTSLMNEVFVLTATASVSPNIAEAGTSKAVNVSVDANLGKGRTQVDEITIDGTKYTGEIPYTHSATATTTHTYNITVKKGTKTANASATINFYNASYYGVVDASKTSLTATEVKALKTKEVKSRRSGTRTFNLTNQKACIAYPQSFGAAESIKDANGFDYLASYTRSEVTIDSVVYYVYLLSSPTTITDFKQIIN